MCSSQLRDIPCLTFNFGILLGNCSWQEGLRAADDYALVPCERMCASGHREILCLAGHSRDMPFWHSSFGAEYVLLNACDSRPWKSAAGAD